MVTLKNVTSRVLTRFSFDLARWPNFRPQKTQFQNWPRNHPDKHFEQYSWLLQNITLRVLTSFPLILPKYLVFDPNWLSFELDLESSTKTFQARFMMIWYLKNVTSRVLTRFSFDLPWWPSFWHQVIKFWTWPRFHRGKHTEQDSLRRVKTVTSSVNKLFVDHARHTMTDRGWSQ